MPKLIIIILLLLSFTLLNSKDIVVTKDGNIYRGIIEKYSDKELKIRINENNLFTLNSSDILTVDFDNKIETQQQIQTDYKNGIGVSLGYPGGYNVNFDFVVNELLIGISLGSNFDFLYSGELSLRYPLYQTKNIYIAPSFILGYQYFYHYLSEYYYPYNTLSDSKYYAAGAFNLSIYGIFVTFGITPRSGSYLEDYIFPSPLYLKFGYNYYY